MSAPDAVLVGGGVIGAAIAFELAREGVRVTLFERDEVAGHASGAAAGMLLPCGEAPGAGPFLSWASRSLAAFPELTAELRDRTGIDPEYEASGALHVAGSEGEAQALRAKADAIEGFGLEWLDPQAARAAEPLLAQGVGGALFCPREAHVRSPLLARALAAAAVDLGARVETGAPAIGLRREGARVTGVETTAGARDAGCVVLCMGVWTPDGVAWLGEGGAPGVPIEPVKGQILALDAPRRGLRAIVSGRDAYLVPKRDASVVVGATEERAGFDCRVTVAGLAELLAAAPRLVPALADAGFRHGWAGLRPKTPDGLPAIGPVPGIEGLLLAAGHYRNGVLLAPITARLVADLVLGKGWPADADAFLPSRFSAGESA